MMATSTAICRAMPMMNTTHSRNVRPRAPPRLSSSSSSFRPRGRSSSSPEASPDVPGANVTPSPPLRLSRFSLRRRASGLADGGAGVSSSSTSSSTGSGGGTSGGDAEGAEVEAPPFDLARLRGLGDRRFRVHRNGGGLGEGLVEPLLGLRLSVLRHRARPCELRRRADPRNARFALTKAVVKPSREKTQFRLEPSSRSVRSRPVLASVPRSFPLKRAPRVPATTSRTPRAPSRRRRADPNRGGDARSRVRRDPN